MASDKSVEKEGVSKYAHPLHCMWYCSYFAQRNASRITKHMQHTKDSLSSILGLYSLLKGRLYRDVVTRYGEKCI